MKHLKKTVIAFAVFSMTTIPLSCSSMVLSGVRDGAIEGTSAFVQETMFSLLDSLGIIPDNDD